MVAEKDVQNAPSDCDQGEPPLPPPDGNVSINSTSQSCGEADPTGTIACQNTPVPEQTLDGTGRHQVVAINGLDHRIGHLG